ncbi:hypothetical protein WDU94_004348 [Cyamophila willieti]
MAPVLDHPGYWGERTSTVDWCEKNYVQSYYVAEMWNTVSNLAMIFQAIWGTYGVYKNDLEKKFFIAYTFLFVVGLGSWAFHMTLLTTCNYLMNCPWSGELAFPFIFYLASSIPSQVPTSLWVSFSFSSPSSLLYSISTILYLLYKTFHSDY